MNYVHSDKPAVLSPDPRLQKATVSFINTTLRLSKRQAELKERAGYLKREWDGAIKMPGHPAPTLSSPIVNTVTWKKCNQKLNSW